LHLEYSVQFWAPQFDINKLEEFQWRDPSCLGAGALILRGEAEILALFSMERGSFRDK